MLYLYHDFCKAFCFWFGWDSAILIQTKANNLLKYMGLATVFWGLQLLSFTPDTDCLTRRNNTSGVSVHHLCVLWNLFLELLLCYISITKERYKENVTEFGTAIGNPLECKRSVYCMDIHIPISCYELWISFWSKICLRGSFSNLNLIL